MAGFPASDKFTSPRRPCILSRMEAPPAPIDLSIVLPVFNEEANLEPLDAELRGALAGLGLRSEILYVDDGSRDGSAEILQRIAGRAAGSPIRTRVVRLRRNYGQTKALAAGFELAEGSVVIPLDADGQNDPTDLGGLLAKLDEGYDVVSGWRKDRKDAAFSRKFPSWAANWLIGRVSGVRLHDYGCTMKAYRAALLKELRLYGEMHRFIPLYLGLLGAKVTELPVNHRPRRAGKSKYGAGRIIRVLLDIVLIRFMTKYHDRPMQFFGLAATGFFLAQLLTFAFMIVFKYGWLRFLGIGYRASFIETPLPVLAAVFFLGGICSLFFGILGEILIRIEYESRGARPYAIAQVVDSQ